MTKRLLKAFLIALPLYLAASFLISLFSDQPRNIDTPEEKPIEKKQQAEIIFPAQEPIEQETDITPFEETEEDKFAGYNFAAVVNPQWKLISGDPNDTCTRVISEGEAKIHGWYVWDNFYVEKEWMLYIADEDLERMPFYEKGKDYSGYQHKVKLLGADKKLEDKLKKADKDHPQELTIRGYFLYCEGTAIASVQDAREAFKRELERKIQR